MNEYIIPIYNRNKNKVYIKKYLARSFNECKNKIMEDFQNYDLDWSDFIDEISDEYIFGDVKDIEEL